MDSKGFFATKSHKILTLIDTNSVNLNLNNKKNQTPHHITFTRANNIISNKAGTNLFDNSTECTDKA
jgi:hypothetical protein